MYRIDSSDTTDKLPVPTPPGTNPNSYFRKPDAVRGTKGTILTAEWMNTVQEELANAIEGAGLTLEKHSRNQLSKAIGIKKIVFSANHIGTPQVFHFAVITKVLFNSRSVDTNNDYDPVSARYKPSVPGLYAFSASLQFPLVTTANANVATAIAKNGSFQSYHITDHGGVQSNGVSPKEYVVLPMNGTTDYVEVYCSNGFPFPLTLSHAFSFFQGFKVN